MARTRRGKPVPAGLNDLLVLGADGVSKAADNDRSVQIASDRGPKITNAWSTSSAADRSEPGPAPSWPERRADEIRDTGGELPGSAQL